jgi:hypothetical protein
MIPLVRYKENEFLCICIVAFQISRRAVMHPLALVTKNSATLRPAQVKKPARRPVEEEIKRAEKEKADQKANW